MTCSNSFTGDGISSASFVYPQSSPTPFSLLSDDSPHIVSPWRLPPPSSEASHPLLNRQYRVIEDFAEQVMARL
jgi:hypothetical protein